MNTNAVLIDHHFFVCVWQQSHINSHIMEVVGRMNRGRPQKGFMDKKDRVWWTHTHTLIVILLAKLWSNSFFLLYLPCSCLSRLSLSLIPHNKVVLLQLTSHIVIKEVWRLLMDGKLLMYLTRWSKTNDCILCRCNYNSTELPFITEGSIILWKEAKKLSRSWAFTVQSRWCHRRTPGKHVSLEFKEKTSPRPQLLLHF